MLRFVLKTDSGRFFHSHDRGDSSAPYHLCSTLAEAMVFSANVRGFEATAELSVVPDLPGCGYGSGRVDWTPVPVRTQILSEET